MHFKFKEKMDTPHLRYPLISIESRLTTQTSQNQLKILIRHFIEHVTCIICFFACVDSFETLTTPPNLSEVVVIVVFHFSGINNESIKTLFIPQFPEALQPT